MIDYRIGDGRALIADVPDGSVHLIATSPPFLALRSYLPANHEHKHAEIGSEPDPAAFLDTLLGLTAEWGRVLAPWGSIAIELGDTFANAAPSGNAYGARPSSMTGITGGQQWPADSAPKMSTVGPGWPRAKSLSLIPQLYATSLAYGRNLLTGAPSPAGQWLVRNVVVWHRPNPAVGALGDKYRPSTSYITVATRSPKRWFDLTAVRGEPVTPMLTRVGAASASRGISGGDSGNADKERLSANPAGAPPLDCWFDHDGHDTWTVTTQPSRLAHYAMWPAKLAERLILSMCPAEVCAECGEPRRRLETKVALLDGVPLFKSVDASARDHQTGAAHGFDHNRLSTNITTLGWTDCGHDAYRPGVVLDPFAGTGTTLAVADLHHRHGLGFDLDPRNALLVEPRRAEVARNLFGTVPEIPGQLAMEIPA